MTTPRKYRAAVSGSWSQSNGGRHLHLTVVDPASRDTYIEIILDADGVLDMLSNRQTEQPNADVRLWPTDRLGKHHQRVELSLLVDGCGDEALMKAVQAAHRIISPHGFLISNQDMKWNPNRCERIGNGRHRYRIHAHRYTAEENEPIPAEVSDLTVAARKIKVLSTPSRRKARAAKNGKAKASAATKTPLRPEVYRAE
jgi:hypothetical protein